MVVRLSTVHSVHWWDRLPNLPNALVDWAELSGTILSLLALVLALLALAKSKRDLAIERHRQHELDILRDVGKSVASFPDGQVEAKVHELIPLLMMLPSQDLPLTRAAFNMPTSLEASRQLDERLDELLTPEYMAKAYRPPDQDQETWETETRGLPWVRIQAIAKMREDGSCDFFSELLKAVDARVKA